MQSRKLTKTHPQTFQLSLRIRHPSIDPEELSREFQIKPEHSFQAGDARSAGSNVAALSVHAETYWLGTLDPATWSPDLAFPNNQTLQSATARIRAAAVNSLGWAVALSANQFFYRHAELLRRIRSEGGDLSLLLALSPLEVGTFSLAPEISRVFGDLGVALEFEVFEA